MFLLILSFIISSLMLGVGLAMDAFSVSVTHGLKNPKMKVGLMCVIAGTFAVFQALMPLIGWACVHTIVSLFAKVQPFIPWIGFALLLIIGAKMIFDGIKDLRNNEDAKAIDNKDPDKITAPILLLQGVATSIDALSVGFAISEYNVLQAVIAAMIIAAVTFILCVLALILGKKIGPFVAGKADIVGGIILILIGISIVLF